MRPSSSSLRRSDPSSNLRMPRVFVIPPEEEQQDNPPWCCFDADENNDTSPSNPDVPYLLQQSEQDVPAPMPRRTSVHHSRLRIPISKKLEKKQRPEAITIIEIQPSQARQRGTRDSDVIEVVKVKRGREALMDLEENVKVKRSRTLKARATKALQSIKNVGKGSHRTHVKELWTSSESMPGIFRGVQEQIRFQQDQTESHPPPSPAKKGSLSQKNSRSLSQVFRPAKPSRQASSFTVRAASPIMFAEAHHDISVANSSSLSHLRYTHTNPSLNRVQSTHMIDGALNRPVSPSPPMKKNTKFSVRELHRLFSLSSSSPDDPPSAPPTATVPFISVPIGDEMCADARILDFESPDRKLVSRYHTHNGDDLSTPRRLSDLSIEMKLDSLHFDALSFDPEDFDVSMNGNMLR